MVSFTTSQAFSLSPLVWPMFHAIETQFCSIFIKSSFIDFLLDRNFGRGLVFYFNSVLVCAFKALCIFKGLASPIESKNNNLC